MDIKYLIKQFIHNELFFEKKNIFLDDATQLLAEGIIDSLGIMKLLAFLEETFSIRMKEEELIPENFESIEVISHLVEKKTKT